jgi:hypothetical protein
MKTDAVIESVVRVLSPYIGDSMAQASARAHCEKLGIRGAELDTAQAEALVTKIAHGLAVFVGREKSHRIVAEIRAAVGLGGAP